MRVLVTGGTLPGAALVERQLTAAGWSVVVREQIEAGTPVEAIAAFGEALQLPLLREFCDQLRDGVVGAAVSVVYPATGCDDAGHNAMLRQLAASLAPRVRVNAVVVKWSACPPEEIAAAVGLVLASPAMTGTVILLDGGRLDAGIG